MFQILWPDGKFFMNIGGGIPTRPSDPQSQQAKSDIGGSKSHQPESFEQQLEAARRASDIKKLLFGEHICTSKVFFRFCYCLKGY